MTFPTTTTTSSHDDASPQRSRRVVSFAPTAKVTRIMPLSQYTKDEIKAAWYTSDEYAKIAHKARKIIDRMERSIACPQQNNNTKNYQYCTRGLESFVGQRAQQKQNNRERAYQIVLDDSCPNDVTIARQYQLASLQCQVEACIRGRNDYKRVRSYLASSSQRRRRSAEQAKPEDDCISPRSLSPLPRRRNEPILPTARAA